MKTRVYKTVLDLMFCPNCHQQVRFPFQNINLQGTLRIKCGNCSGGMVVVEGNKTPKKSDPKPVGVELPKAGVPDSEPDVQKNPQPAVANESPEKVEG